MLIHVRNSVRIVRRLAGVLFFSTSIWTPAQAQLSTISLSGEIWGTLRYPTPRGVDAYDAREAIDGLASFDQRLTVASNETESASAAISRLPTSTCISLRGVGTVPPDWDTSYPYCYVHSGIFAWHEFLLTTPCRLTLHYRTLSRDGNCDVQGTFRLERFDPKSEVWEQVGNQEWSRDPIDTCVSTGRYRLIIQVDSLVRIYLPDQDTAWEFEFSFAEQNECDADLDGDGVVAGADLGLLLNRWGGVAGGFCNSPEPVAGLADLDRNGFIDGSDLGLLLAYWGPCPN
jgi:hypothetical protein